MAFKFKTKKRPSATQAFAGGFAQGVSSGIQQAAQLSLQDRLKRQEDEKNRLKRELDLFNGMVSNVEQTQANREAIMRGKRMIIASDGKTGASTVFSSVSPDFQFMPSKEEEEAITRQVSTAEKKAMETADMITAQPTPFEKEKREQEARIRLGLDLPPSQKSRAKLTPAQITKTIENLYDEMNAFWRKSNNLPPLSDVERDKKLNQINELRGMKLNMTPTITVPSESTSVGMPSDVRTSLEGF
jgi:hypothetical protein